MSEVLGLKNRPPFGKAFRNGSSFQLTFVSVEQELRAQASRTSMSATRDSVRAKCRILLQGNEFVKLGSISGPADVVRSFLSVSKGVLIVMVPLAFNACLENRTPVVT